MKKREYNFSSLLIITIIMIVINVILSALIDNETITPILSSIISAIGGFIIAAGLIKNRYAATEEYIMNIKSLNLNFVAVQIVKIGLVAINSLILGTGIISSVSTIMLLIQSGNIIRSIGSIFGLMLLYALMSMIIELITSYANFVVADPRNKDDRPLTSISKMFSVSFALILKTLALIFKKYILPVVIYFVAMIILMVILNSHQGLLLFVMIVLSIAFVVYMIYAVISFQADLSDIYLNFVGDYQEEDPKHIVNKTLNLTRQVENEETSENQVVEDGQELENDESLEEENKSQE